MLKLQSLEISWFTCTLNHPIFSSRKSEKTRIMQSANLDWRSFNRYFDFLVGHGFVGNGSEPDERKTYELTEKGKDLLMKLQEVEEMLQMSSI